MRIGLAPLHNPKSPFNHAKRVAQMYYLQVLMRHHPQLMEKIQELTFPVRKVQTGEHPYFDDAVTIAEAERRLSAGDEPVERREFFTSIPDFSSLDELFASLGLPDDGKGNYWFRETVYEFWQSSERNEDGSISVMLHHDVNANLKVAYSLPPEVQEAVEGCDPTQEDEAAFSNRIAALIKKDLKRHYNKVKTTCIQKGFLEAPQKKARETHSCILSGFI